MSRLFSIPVAVAVTVFGFANVLSAADQPGAAAKTAIAGPSIENSAAAACDTCGKVRPLHSLHFKHTKTCIPYQTTFAPGACFGYFQTQWHRWENVCPIPYQGVGLSDTPVRPGPGGIRPTITPKTGGSDGPIPLPRVSPVPAK